MGASLQWRQPPPDRVDRHRGEVVDLARRSRAYLAHSDRVGPGVLLLEGAGRERADAWNELGFTVLVPDDLAPDASRLVAAARFLTDNWHPRLGIVGRGGAGLAAARELIEHDQAADVAILYEPDDLPETPSPLIAHVSAARAPKLQARADALATAGTEVELHVYDADPGFSARASTEADLADERTIDALAHYLS